MAFLDDPDLHFLGWLTSRDLDVLHNILVYDKKSNKRWTCGLSACPDYQKFFPKHSRYWQAMAEELQLYGGNTIANLKRGHGVPYAEILSDVCSKLKIKYDKKQKIIQVEELLLLDILKKAMEKATPEERREIFKTFNLDSAINMTGPAAFALLQILIRTNGFAAYKLAVIIANSAANTIGIPMTIAANAALTKAISVFAGPIGVVITGMWAAWIVSGPAYRVTFPAVIQIAYLRRSLMQGKIGKFLPRTMYILKNYIFPPTQSNNLTLPQ